MSSVRVVDVIRSTQYVSAVVLIFAWLLLGFGTVWDVGLWVLVLSSLWRCWHWIRTGEIQ